MLIYYNWQEKYTIADFMRTTENIISDEIDYSIVIERYIQVVKELFEK